MTIDIKHCRPRARQVYALLNEGWQSQGSIFRALETTEARAYIAELRKILPHDTIEDRWVKHPTKKGVRYKEWRIKPAQGELF